MSAFLEPDFPPFMSKPAGPGFGRKKYISRESRGKQIGKRKIASKIDRKRRDVPLERELGLGFETACVGKERVEGASDTEREGTRND